jgi:hypothetical protein
VLLKLIKAGSKKFTNIKLFFITKSRRILKIKKPKLIRIYYKYKAVQYLVKATFNLLINGFGFKAIKLYKKPYI